MQTGSGAVSEAETTLRPDDLVSTCTAVRSRATTSRVLTNHFFAHRASNGGGDGPFIDDGDQIVLCRLLKEGNEVPFATVGFNVILIQERIATSRTVRCACTGFQMPADRIEPEVNAALLADGGFSS